MAVGRTHASSVIWPVIDSAVDAGTSTPSCPPPKVERGAARTPARTACPSKSSVVPGGSANHWHDGVIPSDTA